MKYTKKIFILLLAVLLLGGLLSACTPDTPVTPDDGEHVHEGGEWQHNSYIHWSVCECGANLNVSEHSGGTATYDAKPICDICGTEYGTHLHISDTWLTDISYHWKKCDCGESFERSAHTGGTATYTSRPTCEVCGKEYGTHIHQYERWHNDSQYHWQSCACGTITEKTPHTGGTATYASGPICEACGEEYGEPLPIETLFNIPGLLSGDRIRLTDSFHLISPESLHWEIENRMRALLPTIGTPLYWIYYLRGIGYSQTFNVVSSEAQIVGYVQEGNKIYTYPLLDVQYTAYDKDGNVIEFSAEHGKNPVGDMLKKMLSDVYDATTGEVIGESVLSNGVNTGSADATPYKATGTGREASDAPQDGTASVLTVDYTDINIKFPENYLEDCLYYNHYGTDFPIIFGIEYTLDGLKDEELEKEINAFIADACKKVEEKFAEAYAMYNIFSVNGDLSRYCLDGDIFYTPPEGIPQHISPSTVEITGQNGYLSVLVYTGFYKVANDDGEPCPYYALSATYDLRTGERLESLSDLFPKGSEFIDQVSSSLRIVDIGSAGFTNVFATSLVTPVILTEKEVEVFTYNQIVLPFYSSIFDLGCIATFSCDSLAYEYCDMKQFFTAAFKGSISDKKLSRRLNGDRFIPIGTSDSAGVYIPEDASPTLVKAAEHLAEYVEQLVSEDVALKMFHDAGYTEVVKVDHTFPQFIVYEVGNMFYQFNLFIKNTSDWGEEVYTAYDANGNAVYAGSVNVIAAEPFMDPYYYFQDTGEKVTFVLKDGWEEVTTVSLNGEKYVYSELDEKPEINMNEIDYWEGTYDVMVSSPTHGRAYITIPIEYILLQ